MLSYLWSWRSLHIYIPQIILGIAVVRQVILKKCRTDDYALPHGQSAADNPTAAANPPPTRRQSTIPPDTSPPLHLALGTYM